MSISDQSQVDYHVGIEREEIIDSSTINYLTRQGIITHVIVESKMQDYETNVVAQVRSSFVSIY